MNIHLITIYFNKKEEIFNDFNNLYKIHEDIRELFIKKLMIDVTNNIPLINYIESLGKEDNYFYKNAEKNSTHENFMCNVLSTYKLSQKKEMMEKIKKIIIKYQVSYESDVMFSNFIKELEAKYSLESDLETLEKHFGIRIIWGLYRHNKKVYLYTGDFSNIIYEMLLKLAFYFNKVSTCLLDAIKSYDILSETEEFKEGEFNVAKMHFF